MRHLIELLDGAVEQAYRDTGVPFRPRFTPVLRALLELEPSTIGQIAENAGITQPAATQTVALMIKEGLLSAEPGPEDGRQRLIRLTDKGRELLPSIQVCWQATKMAADSLDAELRIPLSELLEDACAVLDAKSFRQRIAEARDTLISAAEPHAGPDGRPGQQSPQRVAERRRSKSK